MAEESKPSHNLTISEQLAYSTVRIESQDSKGEVSTGTAFFFRCFENGDQYVPVLVTNKHVIGGGQIGKFHLTLRNATGGPEPAKHVQLQLGDFAKRWLPHPDNAVDLAIMPIAPLLDEATQQGKQFFFITLDKKLIPTPTELADLGALEDVIMIGYPNGIWDKVNNMPIFRRGITATHPNLDYLGKREFMIDAACFPGSSGGHRYFFTTSEVGRPGAGT